MQQFRLQYKGQARLKSNYGFRWIMEQRCGRSEAKKNFGPRAGRGLCDVEERQSPAWEGEEEKDKR